MCIFWGGWYAVNLTNQLRLMSCLFQSCQTGMYACTHSGDSSDDENMSGLFEKDKKTHSNDYIHRDIRGQMCLIKSPLKKNKKKCNMLV